MAPFIPAACETRRKPTRLLILAAFVAFVSLPSLAAAQASEPPREGAAAAAVLVPAGEHRAEEHAAAEHATGEHREGEEQHGRGIIDDIARFVNFAILVATITYLFGGQLRTYIAERGTQIRGDLVNAAETKQTASAQIAEIEKKMRALPGELEALRAQGAQEIAAEEARINAAAAIERDRLLEQARREIDMRTRVAERELVAHAANLAVGVAGDRIKKSITDADQQRLVDQYVGQLKA